MHNALARTSGYFLILSLVFLAGCSEFHSVERDEAAASNPFHLSVGDTVSLDTKDGQHYEFEVTGITGTSILGEHVEIPFDQVFSAKIEEIDKMETAKAVGLGAFVTAALGLIAIMLLGALVVAP